MKKNLMDTKITLEDVARAANVSRSTASLVVNGSSRISEATRKRVQSSMKQLGYIYNHKAASLRTQRSHTIGVIVTDITNSFYAELLHGIDLELQRKGYVALVGNSTDQLETQSMLIQTMRERSVDGLILVPAIGTRASAIQELKTAMPLTLVARYTPGVAADYVGIDNELGARRAVESLIELGHRRIAFIGGAAESSARRDRIQGYTSMLERHNLKVDNALIVTSPVTRTGGFQAITALLTQKSPPTAALCYNDVVAFGVMLGLRQGGLEPGQQFSVIGFDNVEEAALWSPPLATVATSASFGEEAARLILQRIAKPHEGVQQVILPSNLILRDSVNKSV